MNNGQVPPALHEKFTLLRYFAQYMDENLTEGGEGGGRGGKLGPPRPPHATPIPQIKRWIRTPKAIIMHLTNGTIQVRKIRYQTFIVNYLVFRIYFNMFFSPHISYNEILQSGIV